MCLWQQGCGHPFLYGSVAFLQLQKQSLHTGFRKVTHWNFFFTFFQSNNPPSPLEFPLIIILGVIKYVYILKPKIVKLVTRIVFNMDMIATGNSILPSQLLPKRLYFSADFCGCAGSRKVCSYLFRVPTKLRQSLCQLQERSRLKLALDIIKCDLTSLGEISPIIQVSPERSVRLSCENIKFNETPSFLCKNIFFLCCEHL